MNDVFFVFLISFSIVISIYLVCCIHFVLFVLFAMHFFVFYLFTGMIVTGHDHGMLCLWHNVDALVKTMVSGKVDTQRAQCTTLHWHAHAVSAVAMSADGVNVFSGGEEGVLVLWQIDTGYKTFVPRLGAAITHVYGRYSMYSFRLYTSLSS